MLGNIGTTDRSQTSLFGVSTIEQYLDLCERAVAELQENPGDVLRGFAVALTINHIPDWLRYKLTENDRSALDLPCTTVGGELEGVFEAENEDIVLIRQIANGFKHLAVFYPTRQVSGYGMGSYGIGPYGRPYLLIDKGEGLEPDSRWDVGSDLTKRSLKWWQRRLLAIL